MSRILVVEDNEMNAMLARDVLKHRGHEVVEAKTIGIARERLRAIEVDLVLTDLRLPDGTGDQLLRDVRADAALAHLPVVVVTASAMDGDRERILGLGFDGYVSKPLRLAAFERDVEDFLAMGKQRRSDRKQS